MRGLVAGIVCLFLTIISSFDAALAATNVTYDNPSGIHCSVKANKAGLVSVTLDKIPSDNDVLTFAVDNDAEQTCAFTGQAAQIYAAAQSIELVLPHAPGGQNAYIGVTAGGGS